MVTTEDLITEAYKRYPPGTIYWNLNRNGKKSDPFEKIENLPLVNENFEFEISCNISIDGSCIIVAVDKKNNTTHGWVYANGIWADIVNSTNIVEIW